MKSDRRGFIATSLLTAGAFTLAPARAKATPPLPPSRDAPLHAVRGRVVCLTEELQKQFQIAPDCDTRGHVYTLKTPDGKLFPFLPVDTAAAVWMDERYRQRDLQITVRKFPQTNFIEVIKFQSW